MQFDLILVPNPILKDICEPVKKLDWKTKELISAMKKNLWQRNALGISAPQLGVTKRIIACRYVLDNNEDSLRVMINPSLVGYSNDTSISVEGCLSIPGVQVGVERYSNIKVRYLNEKMVETEVYAKEIEGFVIQHEIDHLNGILMIEKQIKEMLSI